MVDGSKKIDGLGNVVAYIRSSSGPVRATVRSKGTAGTPAARPPRSIEALKERIRAKVAANPAAAGTAEVKKMMVREILTWEFGEQFQHHPEFGSIVEAVSGEISGNNRLNRDIDDILNQFKA